MGRHPLLSACIVWRNPMTGKSTTCCHVCIVRRHSMTSMTGSLLHYYFCIMRRLQCQESLHCYHFCIVWREFQEKRNPMTGKSTFAVTFVLWEDINEGESMLYYHFLHCAKSPMSGKSTLLSLLYCVKRMSGKSTLLSLCFW